MAFSHLRVLVVHNRYQQRGGEDVGVQDEMGVLLRYGHEVRLLEANNDHVNGFVAKSRTAASAVYSWPSKRRVANTLSAFRPDVVHVHNFFPQFSPSIYYACSEARIPVVQTLHNYRLICPKGSFYRDGQVCEDCLGKSLAWPGVIRACYRSSRLGTATVAAMNYVHAALKTYQRNVSALIVLTEFARQKFVRGGLPPEKLVVKSPFVDVDPGIGPGPGNYVLFVGRLSEEKGVITLLKAWERLGARTRLKIAGEGALADYVCKQAANIQGIEYLGYKSRSELNRLMRDATALVFPSLWYEGAPRTILESFAVGRPVIASKLGAMEHLVRHRQLGLHFIPGDPADLVRQVEWMTDHPADWEGMRRLVRTEYETKYTAARNYEILMQIYEAVCNGRPVAQLSIPHTLSAPTAVS